MPAQTHDHAYPLEGGCTCRRVRDRMLSKPLFVHGCHCRWCQHETGSAFVLNAPIESDRVELVARLARRDALSATRAPS